MRIEQTVYICSTRKTNGNCFAGRLPAHITVFVSAALIMILALLCTSLESARVSALRYYMKTAADAALFSLFSEYHSELMERYHLFFLEDNGQLAERAEYYLSYYENPEQDLMVGGANFFRFKTEAVRLADSIYASNNKGYPFQAEILAYMKYGLAETLIDQVKDKLNISSQCGEIMKITKQLMPLTDQVFELENQYVQLKENTEDISYVSERTVQEILSIQELLEDREAQQAKVTELEVQAASAAGLSQLASQIDVEGAKWKLKGIEDQLDAAVFQAEQNRETLLRLTEISEEQFRYIQEETAVLKSQFDPIAAEIEELLPQLSDHLREAAKHQTQTIAAYTQSSGQRKVMVDAVKGKISGLTDFLKENDISEIVKDGGSNDGENSYCQLDDCLTQLKERGENIWPNTLETAEEPLETSFLDEVKAVLSQGVTALVIGSGEKLSERQLGEDQLLSGKMDQEEGSSEWKPDNIMDSLYEIVAISEYMIQVMPSYTDSAAAKDKEGYYDLEYILGSSSSDRDNLGETLEKLLLLRGGMNLIYLIGDEGKKAEAGAAAAALTGRLGAAPLAELVKWVLLIAWALTEAVTDVRALTDGKTVPFIKSSSDWKTSLFSGVGKEKILEKSIDQTTPAQEDNTAGMDYETYIRILLCLMPQEQKLYRCMDMVQWNIRQKDADFSLERCLCYSVLHADMQADQLFPGLPLVFSKLSSSGYRFTVTAERSYLDGIEPIEEDE